MSAKSFKEGDRVQGLLYTDCGEDWGRSFPLVKVIAWFYGTGTAGAAAYKRTKSLFLLPTKKSWRRLIGYRVSSMSKPKGPAPNPNALRTSGWRPPLVRGCFQDLLLTIAARPEYQGVSTRQILEDAIAAYATEEERSQVDL